jgi:hypothetical protein
MRARAGPIAGARHETESRREGQQETRPSTRRANKSGRTRVTLTRTMPMANDDKAMTEHEMRSRMRRPTTSMK